MPLRYDTPSIPEVFISVPGVKTTTIITTRVVCFTEPPVYTSLNKIFTGMLYHSSQHSSISIVTDYMIMGDSCSRWERCCHW